MVSTSRQVSMATKILQFWLISVILALAIYVSTHWDIREHQLMAYWVEDLLVPTDRQVTMATKVGGLEEILAIYVSSGLSAVYFYTLEHQRQTFDGSLGSGPVGDYIPPGNHGNQYIWVLAEINDKDLWIPTLWTWVSPPEGGRTHTPPFWHMLNAMVVKFPRNFHGGWTFCSAKIIGLQNTTSCT